LTNITKNITENAENSLPVTDKYLKYLISGQQTIILGSSSVIIHLVHDDGTLAFV